MFACLDRSEVAQDRNADRANEIAKLLEADLTFNPEKLTIYYDFIGEGYGIPTKECIEAIKLMARTEGILLVPVSTGKAMAGLIDLIGKGKFSSKAPSSSCTPGVLRHYLFITKNFHADWQASFYQLFVGFVGQAHFSPEGRSW